LKIKAIIEKEDGKRELTAVIDEQQHRYLLEHALADILSKGVMVPVVHDDVVTIVEMDERHVEPTA